MPRRPFTVRRVFFLTLVGASIALWCLSSFNSRRLPGGYSLEWFDENGKYYVTGEGSPDAGGAFDGTINQIGWKDSEILANVTRIYRGDRDGWYVLDVKTRVIRGPLSDADVAGDAMPCKIQCHPPNEE